MFVSKKAGQERHVGNAVSLIDKNGSFRGEAKFDTLKEAEQYMEVYYKKRMKKQVDVKVFDDS